MKITVLFLSILIASGVFFVNMYNSLIDAHAWGAGIPHSIEVTRAYYSKVNPGNFFRVFSPINQLVALVALIAFWKSSPAARIYLGIALLIYIGADVFTFLYFYPRNDIMFTSDIASNLDKIKTAWQQWSRMNWVRSAIVLTGVVFSLLALHTVYKLR